MFETLFWKNLDGFMRAGMTEREVAFELEQTMRKMGAEDLAFASIVDIAVHGALERSRKAKLDVGIGRSAIELERTHLARPPVLELAHGMASPATGHDRVRILRREELLEIFERVDEPLDAALFEHVVVHKRGESHRRVLFSVK